MTATLQAEPRAKLGSRDARKLRAAGRIPVSIQGESKDVLHGSIEEHAFLTARRHHEHLFEVRLGSEAESVVVRELQYDAFGDRIVHVEFMRVVLGREMETEVEIHTTGRPRGGVANVLVQALPIRSIPSKIPDSIEVKVDGLEPGAHIQASDLVLPEGVSLGCEPDLQVVTIVAPRGEEEEEEPTAEEAAEGEAPAEEAEEGEAPSSED